MKTSAELRQERQSEIDAQKKLDDLATAENRGFTAVELTTFDAHQKRIDALKDQIDRAEKFEKNRTFAAAAAGTPTDGGEEKEKSEIKKRFSIIKALRAANPAMKDVLEGVEKEVNEIGMAESRAAGVTIPEETGFSLPMSFLSRATAQTVSEDSGEYGGALVVKQAPRMVDPLRPRLWAEDLGATFLTGLSGGDVPLIVDNDFTLTFLAETAAITPHKKIYAGPSLSPKRAGGAVDVSNRLLMQSSIDVEARILNGLRTGFAQLLHGSIINGAGGVAPTGILSYTGVNAAVATAGVPATWARIVELQSLIEEDNATERSLGWLLHPKLKGALKQIKKDAGSGRFLLDESGIDAIKYISTSLVPVLTDGGDPALTVYPLIYGDWSQMVIGQWGALSISINPYSADLSNSLRLVLNTHADMQIANPKAFAKNAFLTDAVA